MKTFDTKWIPMQDLWYNFEKVDIFLRVKWRLPMQEWDWCTQEVLDEYVQKYEAGELTAWIVPLAHMYNLIKNWKIKAE